MGIERAVAFVQYYQIFHKAFKMFELVKWNHQRLLGLQHYNLNVCT